MRLIVLLVVAVCALSSCEGNVEASSNEFSEYFYVYDTVPKVFVYRDISNGIEEEFHRVFGITDSEGKHIVVEIYSDDGRLLEALNYNTDSLDIADHMVVNREQENKQSVVSESQLFPLTEKDTGFFATNFEGIMDSTFFLKYIERTFVKNGTISVMGEEKEMVEFRDDVLLKLYNPWKNLEDAREGKVKLVFAKGYGLVDWSTEKQGAHYTLEKIISQNEFIELMSRI